MTFTFCTGIELDFKILQFILTLKITGKALYIGRYEYVSVSVYIQQKLRNNFHWQKPCDYIRQNYGTIFNYVIINFVPTWTCADNLHTLMVALNVHSTLWVGLQLSQEHLCFLRSTCAFLFSGHVDYILVWTKVREVCLLMGFAFISKTEQKCSSGQSCVQNCPIELYYIILASRGITFL